MAKTNISQWDTVAGNNLDLNSISVAEGWLPSTVNNFEREEISQLAKFYDDFGGVNTVGGTANAITITTSTVFTALATGMRMRMVAANANSGATTLNLDAIGAKAVRKIVGGTDAALVANDILAGNHYDIVYSAAANSAAGGWIILPSNVQLPSGIVIAGTYTPTLFNTTNIDASTANLCQYMQVGSTVTVSGSVAIDPTAAASTLLGMSIPIPSNLSGGSNLGGAGCTVNADAWAILGDGTNDRATFQTVVTYTISRNVFFSFTYQMI